MQILKDVYQLGGSINGLTWRGSYGQYEDASVYVVRADGGLIMFDCGCGDTLDEIFSNMRLWGLEPGDIAACFLTHAHFDHAGAGSRLSALGVAMCAHKNTAEAVEAGDERTASYLYHRAFTPFKVDKVLEDKNKVTLCGLTVEVLHMPGHTAGCTAYAFKKDGKKIVVSGDIIGTLMDGYFGWNGSFDFDKQLYMESLLRFSRMDFDIMLPGHGMVYYGKPRVRVEDALAAAYEQWR